jgi:hypothetical protein
VWIAAIVAAVIGLGGTAYTISAQRSAASKALDYQKQQDYASRNQTGAIVQLLAVAVAVGALAWMIGKVAKA